MDSPPLDYGDPAGEVRAVRGQIGLFDRSDRGKLVLTGADRFSWLQGMVSNDVRRIESGAPSIQACILNATGHLLADVTIVNRTGSLLLDLDPANRAKIYEFLGQFLIIEDVEIVDQSEFLACLSVQGPAVDENILRKLAGADAHLNAADHTGAGGFDIYTKAAGARELWQRLVAAGIPQIREDAAETLRIEAGIPRYGIDMDEGNIPLECNLEATHISHIKGCYVGQEIIARIHSRGHTNRALTGFWVDGDRLPAPGERILITESETRRDAGWTTSAVFSPTLGRSICLGYLRHEYRDGSHDLRSTTGLKLTVTTLPFIL